MARLYADIVSLCLLCALVFISMDASDIRAQASNVEEAYRSLFRIPANCEYDPECLIITYIPPFERFIRSYPTSSYVQQAAQALANAYERVAELYTQRGATVQAKNTAARAGELRSYANGTNSLPAYLKFEQPQPTPQPTVQNAPAPQPAAQGAPVMAAPPQSKAPMIIFTLVVLFCVGGVTQRFLQKRP